MRFLWLAVACALVACSSRDANVQHDGQLEFGNVEVGEALAATLQVTNTGEKSAELTLSIDSSDFTVDAPTLTLPAGTTALTVRFAPKALGPRSATLKLGEATVALSGRGVGPQLSVPGEVTLGPIAIVTGQPADVLASSVTLRNTGTSGSQLRLGAPRVEGTDELCVGIISGSTCVPWQPPEFVDARTLLEVPLAILANGEGAKRWTVSFPSNDPLNPEVTLEVRALVEAFEPCQFVATPSTVALTYFAPLTIRHTGPGTCLVRSITESTSVVQLTAPPLPIRLASDAALDLELRYDGPSYGFFPGAVQVEAEGTGTFTVPFQRERPQHDCLAVTPGPIDFGSVPLACGARTRQAFIYNWCDEPVVIDRVSVTGAGFSLVSDLAPGTVVANGAIGVPVVLRYQPADLGADTGLLIISGRDRSRMLFPLQGSGLPNERVSLNYRNEVLPIVDLLLMLDTSPSFVPRRESVRSNLMPLLTRLGGGCIDARFAVAAADGDPDAGVRFQPNDAGESWTSSSAPSFVARALSAFDTLPVGSENEACIGPAADLIDDAGVRDGGHLSAICVTDALEHSGNPLGALSRLQRAPGMRWSSIANYGGSCTVEAEDDGVHDFLVRATYGSQADICDPNWSLVFESSSTSCNRRTSYYLQSSPVGPIEVRVDGVLAPPGTWLYDASTGAVTFLPAFVPSPGTTVTLTYDTATCFQ